MYLSHTIPPAIRPQLDPSQDVLSQTVDWALNQFSELWPAFE
jgi:hypothetical protein